ncbi:MAG: hypothetical protein LBM99_04300 [Bacillales bacterium]|jgi:hypothetical protein|nr:hypothetical protein [Bacillales bacterium]
MKKIIALFVLFVSGFFSTGCSSQSEKVLLINDNSYLKENNNFKLQTFTTIFNDKIGVVYQKIDDIVSNEKFADFNYDLIERELDDNKIIVGLDFYRSSSDGEVKLSGYKLAENKIIFIFDCQYDVEIGWANADEFCDSYLISLPKAILKEITIGINNKLFASSGQSVYYH